MDCKHEKGGRVASGMRTMLLSMLALAGALTGCARDVQETPQDPGVVELVAELGHDQVLAEAGGEVLARIRIRAGDVQQGERSPINLALIIDTSGSMEGDAIATARQAAKDVLRMLREGDRVSVTQFASSAELVIESTLVEDADMEELFEKIDDIEARGTTDLAGGLRVALQQLTPYRNAETISRAVLLGDGVPNDPSQVIPLAQQYGNYQLPIASIGLGLENDEVLMGQIAQLSHGHFEYVEESERVAEVFQNELLRMDQTVARGVALALQPGPGVEIIEVLGQNTPAGGGGLNLQLGDMSEGQTREMVVKLSAPGRREGALVELLDARLVFMDAVDNAGRLERSAFLGARANGDPQIVEASRNDSVHETAQALMAANATITAIQMVRTGQVQAATALLRQHQYDFQDDTYRAQAASQQALAEEIESAGAAPAADDAPSAPPARMERTLRRAHSNSMDALGY